MSLQEKILRMQKQAQQALELLFQFTGYATGLVIDVRVLVNELGWSEEEWNSVMDYLENKGWAKRMSHGGLDGAISITFPGISQAEKTILQGNTTAVTETTKPEHRDTSDREQSQTQAQETAVTKQTEEKALFSPTEFDVVDSAVWAYLRRYEHYPATFDRYILSEGAYVQYVIFPDDTQEKNKGILGRLELRKLPKGTSLEWKKPFIKSREQTIEEQREIRAAFQDAVKRHKPDNFDFNNDAQREALDTAVENDVHYRLAKGHIQLKIWGEQSEVLEQYNVRQQEIAKGLAAWLDAQGIKLDQKGLGTAVLSTEGQDNTNVSGFNLAVPNDRPWSATGHPTGGTAVYDMTTGREWQPLLPAQTASTGVTRQQYFTVTLPDQPVKDEASTAVPSSGQQPDLDTAVAGQDIGVKEFRLGTDYNTFETWFKSNHRRAIDGQHYVVRLDGRLGFSYNIMGSSIEIWVEDIGDDGFDQIEVAPHVLVNDKAPAERREASLAMVRKNLLDLKQAATQRFPYSNTAVPSLEQGVEGVKLPTRKSDLRKWYQLWQKIRIYVEKGWNATEIEAEISQYPNDYKNLPTGVRTLQDVINAGDAGLLENPP